MVITAGTYGHDKDENLDDFLTKLGMNFIVRRLLKIGPTLIVEVPADPTGVYVLRMKIPLKTLELTFKLGETVDFTTPSGVKKYVFTEEDGNLVQRSVGPGSDGVVTTREFTSDGMVQVAGSCGSLGAVQTALADVMLTADNYDNFDV